MWSPNWKNKQQRVERLDIFLYNINNEFTNGIRNSQKEFRLGYKLILSQPKIAHKGLIHCATKIISNPSTMWQAGWQATDNVGYFAWTVGLGMMRKNHSRPQQLIILWFIILPIVEGLWVTWGGGLALVSSLWASDALWHLRSWSTLAY